MLPRLKQLRKERGVSQQELADAVGVSQPSINKYENHNIEPDIAVLLQMADFFNTSVDYIVGHTEIRRPIESTEPWCLNHAEARMVTQLRSLTNAQRDCVAHVLDTFTEK